MVSKKYRKKLEDLLAEIGDCYNDIAKISKRKNKKGDAVTKILDQHPELITAKNRIYASSYKLDRLDILDL